MLFFYKFFTFFHPFFQLPNKFYIKKFQYINLKETKIKIKSFIKLLNSVKLREGGKKSERLRGKERGRSREG